MSQRRRTHTKSTELHGSRQLRKFRQTRLEVAAEAARIIATEGQTNYHAAKRKAVDRLGVSERLAMPSNLEVQDALLLYQGLYGGDAHDANLDELRCLAIEAMQSLKAFAPRLVGPVLDGTAGKHSRVSLHVFSDGPEDLVLFLLNKGIPFAQEGRRIRWHDGRHRTIPILVIQEKGTPVELLVFSAVDQRQAPPCPIDGKPQHRANLTEVECLLMPTSGPAARTCVR